MDSTSQQLSEPAKVSQQAFQISWGVFLSVAIIVAAGRIAARFHSRQRVAADDGFFFLALATFIAGTAILFVDIPYIYLLEDVAAGLREIPPDFVEQLIRSAKLQGAAAVLLGTTVMSVKFSFLFFFRGLLRQQWKLLIWWWAIFATLLPTAILLMFSNFISCGVFDSSILVECVSPRALSRQSAALEANSSLDIITDAMLISVPVILLWNVQISLRQKLGLCAILCLSVFTAITAIVKVAGGSSKNGRIDSAWATYWLAIESSVALIVVSISAFRVLFVAHRASKNASPVKVQNPSPSTFNHVLKEQDETPMAPRPSYTGVNTHIAHSPHDPAYFEDSEEIELPLHGSRSILVTHDVRSEKTDPYPGYKSSTESFV